MHQPLEEGAETVVACEIMHIAETLERCQEQVEKLMGFLLMWAVSINSLNRVA